MSASPAWDDRPRLSRIIVYPFKSFPGRELTGVEVLPSGALRGDRRWALVDDAGTIINAKATPLVHRLAAEFDERLQRVKLSDRQNGRCGEFHLPDELPALAEFCAELFGQRLQVIENDTTGIPDDLDALGPTMIAAASLQTVADWFPELDGSHVGARFRANLEFSGAAPFWEDCLVPNPGDRVTFRIGEVTFAGINPCQRCVVPTRDPVTAEVASGFAKRFAAERQRTLPAWAPRERFDHYYRLTVNTALAPDCRGGWLQLGDEVTVLS